MKLSKEFKVGLLVFISGLILWVGFNYLKYGNVFSSDQYFTFKYHNALGIQPTNPVHLNGKRIGRVETIDFMHQNGDSVLIQVSVEPGYKISKAYYATISSTPVVGVTVEFKLVEAAENDRTTLPSYGYYEDGDQVKFKIEKSIQELLTKDAVPTLEKGLESLNKAIEVFDDKTKQFRKSDVGGVLADFKEITSDIKASIKGVKNIIYKVSPMMDSTKSLIAELTTTVRQSRKLMKQLGDTLLESNVGNTIRSATDALVALKDLLNNVNDPKGSTGQFINNKEFYLTTQAMMEDVKFLVADLQANPHRYFQINVFGKQPITSDIIKRAKTKPKKLSGSADVVMTIDLKRNIPEDLKITLLDMTAKTQTELTYKTVSTSSITVVIPGSLSIGKHALSLEYNKKPDGSYSDSDYTSIEKR